MKLRDLQGIGRYWQPCYELKLKVLLPFQSFHLFFARECHYKTFISAPACFSAVAEWLMVSQEALFPQYRASLHEPCSGSHLLINL